MRRTVEAAPDAGIGILSLFAFSSDNWKRPGAEVSALMSLLGDYIETETARCVENGLRLEFIGRRDRLGSALREGMERAEAQTAGGNRLRLRIAIDYSGREAMRAGDVGPAVDLLIRTGGEQRLSDFLLWECAYAELIFSRRMWPDFDADDLRAAVSQYHTRERRLGGLPAKRGGGWLD